MLVTGLPNEEVVVKQQLLEHLPWAIDPRSTDSERAAAIGSWQRVVRRC